MRVKFLLKTGIILAGFVFVNTVALNTTTVFADSPSIEEVESRARIQDRTVVLTYDLVDNSEDYWVYKYRAAPYDFYYNTKTKKWKSVQYISNLEHTVNVMVDGWAKYGPWRPR